PVVRSGDDYRVDIALVQQLAIVQVGLGIVLFGGQLLAPLIDVADRDDLAGVVLFAEGREGLRVVAAAAAASDDSDVNAIVGADHPACRLFGRLGGQRATGGAQRQARGADTL